MIIRRNNRAVYELHPVCDTRRSAISLGSLVFAASQRPTKLTCPMPDDTIIKIIIIIVMVINNKYYKKGALNERPVR